MKQKKMKVSYAKFIQNGKPFNKEKYIEDKLKIFDDMHIVLTQNETGALYMCNSPRQIETVVRAIINSRWN